MSVKFVMTDEEIKSNFKNSINRNKQVGVLAELNDVTKNDMLDKLCQLNLITGIPDGKKPAARYARWSDEDINTIVRMHEQERPTEEIAEMLGRTYGAVQKKMETLGLRSNKNRMHLKTAQATVNNIDNAIELYRLLSTVMSSQYGLSTLSFQATPDDIKINYGNKLLFQITRLEAIE